MIPLTLLAMSLAFTSQVNAAEKKLPVKHFYQDDGCWCGIASMEMFEQFYKPK